MTRDKRGGLSHHEELRYFYLLRNLSYLSESENREFRYLKSKMEAGKPAGYHTPSKPNYGQTSEQTYYPEDTYYPREDYPQNESFAPGGLPLYPQEERLSRRSKQYTKDTQMQEPVYFDDAEYYEDNQEAYYQEDYFEEPKVKAKKKKSLKKTFKLIGIILVVIVLGLIVMFFKGMFDVSNNKKDYKPAVTETFHGVDAVDGTNILVLGSDQRVTQGSSEARTDTIMVVNVGNKEKKIKMVSFMRDTLVNIPGYSYNDYTYDLKLNTSFNLGEQNHNQGADMVRKTLKHNFDIDIKYYVMVDFETFAEAIDTLFPNGVKMDARFATIDGAAVSSVEVPDDLRMKDGVVPDQTIKVGEQMMDGRTLLNYARFRKDDEGDYGRTVRQQQVMEAIMSQIKDPTKLFTGSAAIGKIYALTSTNVSFPFVLQKGLSVMTSGKGVEHVTIPENGDWVDDYDMYSGQGLAIDFDKYQKRLTKIGLR
ncbi:LCP family protein [Streptococcus iniae]|uniref:LCP family protein n=1 Tax=Streptococcus iniae TaxID=1346 RepID=UPI00273F5D5A|nr:LCP family protein [Streptococcus iniae]WLR89247.1 LCP family protein [Streptococcus iniae]